MLPFFVGPPPGNGKGADRVTAICRIRVGQMLCRDDFGAGPDGFPVQPPLSVFRKLSVQSAFA